MEKQIKEFDTSEMNMAKLNLLIRQLSAFLPQANAMEIVLMVHYLDHLRAMQVTGIDEANREHIDKILAALDRNNKIKNSLYTQQFLVVFLGGCFFLLFYVLFSLNLALLFRLVYIYIIFSYAVRHSKIRSNETGWELVSLYASFALVFMFEFCLENYTNPALFLAGSLTTFWFYHAYMQNRLTGESQEIINLCGAYPSPPPLYS